MNTISYESSCYSPNIPADREPVDVLDFGKQNGHRVTGNGFFASLRKFFAQRNDGARLRHVVERDDVGWLKYDLDAGVTEKHSLLHNLNAVNAYRSFPESEKLNTASFGQSLPLAMNAAPPQPLLPPIPFPTRYVPPVAPSLLTSNFQPVPLFGSRPPGPPMFHRSVHQPFSEPLSLQSSALRQGTDVPGGPSMGTGFIPDSSQYSIYGPDRTVVPSQLSSPCPPSYHPPELSTRPRYNEPSDMVAPDPMKEIRDFAGPAVTGHVQAANPGAQSIADVERDFIARCHAIAEHEKRKQRVLKREIMEIERERIEIKRRLINEKLNRIAHWQSQRLSATESDPELDAWIEASPSPSESADLLRWLLCHLLHALTTIGDLQDIMMEEDRETESSVDMSDMETDSDVV